MNLINENCSRRNFVKLGSALTVGALFVPKMVFAKNSAIINKFEKRLKLFNPNTGDHFNEVFWAEGELIPDALKSFDHILRDRYTEECVEINRKLLELLHSLQNKLLPKQPINVFCGYRSTKTNEEYRSRKGGVAKHSRHLTGDAVDFNVPGVQLRELKKAAIKLKAGGVGYYPRSGFIHMDIREKLATW